VVSLLLTSDALLNNQSNEDETNKDPISLFAGLAFPVFQDGKGLSQSPAKPHYGNTTIAAKSKAHYNMSFYDLLSSDGAVATINKSDKKSHGAVEEKPPHSDTSSTTPKEMMARLAGLPNQIKALLLMATREPPVRNNWSGDNSSLLHLPGGKAAFMLNFKTLRKIEAMVGYEVDANGDPLLKRPVWEPLTHSLLQKAGKENLLCRSVKYEDSGFGVHEPVGLRLPVYNKYFIISKPGSGATLLRRGRRLWRDRLSRKINRILRQHRYLSREYLSTAIVSSKRIRPKRARRQEIIKKLDLSKKLKPTRIT